MGFHFLLLLSTKVLLLWTKLILLCCFQLARCKLFCFFFLSVVHGSLIILLDYCCLGKINTCHIGEVGGFTLFLHTLYSAQYWKKTLIQSNAHMQFKLLAPFQSFMLLYSAAFMASLKLMLMYRWTSAAYHHCIALHKDRHYSM